MYGTPSMAGSRSGAIICGTWAAMIRLGYEGYVEKTKKILDASEKIKKELVNLPGFVLISNQNSHVVAGTSTAINCIALCDIIHQKHKWALSKT